eukprot:1533837-Amphidinium_carterae.1
MTLSQWDQAALHLKWVRRSETDKGVEPHFGLEGLPDNDRVHQVLLCRLTQKVANHWKRSCYRRSGLVGLLGTGQARTTVQREGGF